MTSHNINPRTGSRHRTDHPTREKIIDAARAEFCEFGLAGARVDRIAARASVNKAMIYYHFRSKRDLYLEVVADFYQKVLHLIQRRISDVASLEDLLSVMAEVYTGLFHELADFLPILLRELASPQPDVVEQIARTIAETGLPQRAQDMLEAGIEDGRLRHVDIRQAVVSFVTMNLGYFFLAPILDRIMCIEDRQQFINARKQAVVDLFLNGVKVG